MTECNDKKCPFHGNIKLHKRTFTGIIIKKDTHRTALIEFPRYYYLKKYERYEKRRTRLHVHNPSCINANIKDKVIVHECKPLSKTKNFVITKIVK